MSILNRIRFQIYFFLWFYGALTFSMGFYFTVYVMLLSLAVISAMMDMPLYIVMFIIALAGAVGAGIIALCYEFFKE